VTSETQTTHSITFDRDLIAHDAYHIVRILQKRDFTTYLVGGCVRDILLGKKPKDFDIATNAHPKDVKRAIANAFIIGRRFRLVLVKRGDDQYEVSTFRRDPKPEELAEEMPLGDNLFGTPQEDARRRDFTINGLFYDPIENKLIDYADGLADLRIGVVRMIGDPNVRLLEDPIRILRAIRLAHMIRFSLEPSLRLAIQTHAESLLKSALPRRREELLKFLRLDNPALPFLTSLDLGVLDYVSPTLVATLRDTAKNELFLKSLFQFHDHNLETPTELFAGLILAFYLSENNGELHPDFRANEILEDAKYIKLMRDELGLFKSEQEDITKALQLVALLKKRQDFEKRGERRRITIVRSPSFDLALKLCQREHWLSPTDYAFWREEAERLERLSPAPPRDDRKKRRRRRRPFDRNRREPGTSASSEAGKAESSQPESSES